MKRLPLLSRQLPEELLEGDGGAPFRLRSNWSQTKEEIGARLREQLTAQQVELSLSSACELHLNLRLDAS